MRHLHPTFTRNIWISKASCGCPLTIWTEEEYNKANENNWSDYYTPDEPINYISGYMEGWCYPPGCDKAVSYNEMFIKTTLTDEEIQVAYWNPSRWQL